MKGHVPPSLAAIAFGAALVGVPRAMLAQAVANTSYVGTDGRRVLQESVVVGVPPDSVWTAFTTSAGLRSFVAPVAAITLQIGGTWEASYDPGKRIGDAGNILNEILSYLPREMLSIRVRQAPTGFPFPHEIEQVWTVFQFQGLDAGRTRVTCSMLGWRDGSSWDALYTQFEKDNAIVLERLVQRFDSGPIDWSAMASGGGAPDPRR